MKGKVCLVTGGTTGIGFETCRGLAELGAKVLLTGTTLNRAEEAVQRLQGDLVPKQLDLTDFQSVSNLAADILRTESRLDVLIHNAGLVLPKRKVNDQGVEYTLAVVYLGPFLLTQLLGPLIESGPTTRIVNVASDLHRREALDWDDLQSAKKYNFIRAYSRAELAKVLWTRELAKRFQPEVATVNSLHPGGIRTNLFRHFRGPMRWLLWLSDLLKRSPKRGAQTSLYLATSGKVESVTGTYFVNSKPSKVSKLAQDEESAAKLRRESMRILKEGGF